MNVLAIAGSLRAASINAAFCRAAVRLAPRDLRVCVYVGLDALPLFNPDLEPSPPTTVSDLRAAVGRADALLIASPEYAHGISGVMKNTLDWLVSFEGFAYKPVAVVNTAPRAHHAYESLLEVLRTMSATLVAEACVTLPLLGGCATEDEIVNAADVATQVRRLLASLMAFVEQGSTAAPSMPIGP